MGGLGGGRLALSFRPACGGALGASRWPVSRFPPAPGARGDSALAGFPCLCHHNGLNLGRSQFGAACFHIKINALRPFLPGGAFGSWWLGRASSGAVSGRPAAGRSVPVQNGGQARVFCGRARGRAGPIRGQFPTRQAGPIRCSFSLSSEGVSPRPSGVDPPMHGSFAGHPRMRGTLALKFASCNGKFGVRTLVRRCAPFALHKLPRAPRSLL